MIDRLTTRPIAHTLKVPQLNADEHQSALTASIRGSFNKVVCHIIVLQKYIKASLTKMVIGG